MPTLFFRLLGHADKAAALTEALAAVRQGCTHDAAVHTVDPASFSQVPGSPFAYWVSESVRSLFCESSLIKDCCLVASGTGTLDDFRFLRLWFEISAYNMPSNMWFPFAKGGAYSSYYFDHHLVVNWKDDGAEMKAWIVSRYGGGHWARNIRSTEHYFRPGLTWPRRTNGLSFRVLPAGCIFADKGPATFVENDLGLELLALCAMLNSRPFGYLLALQLARTQLAQSYEVGLIQQTPIPDLTPETTQHLATLARCAWSIKRSLDTASETSHAFMLPALLQIPGKSLTTRALAWTERIRESNAKLAHIQGEIDEHAFNLYGIHGLDREKMLETSDNVDEGGAEADNDAADEDHEELTEVNATALVAQLLSYGVGLAFNRFDLDLALGRRPLPPEPEPFAPLPVCSPGMLTGEDGLPLRQAPPGYPLRIAADGIIVDDPDHPDDLVRCVREGLDLVLAPSSMVPGGAKHNGQSTMDWEQEACEILGVRELREYFRKPGKGGFWDDHIKRYSKSRRKAPIYWLLQSSRKNYALWLSYHRLDKDMLFKALMHYVEPKIRLEESRLDTLRAQRVDVGTSGSVAKKLARDIDRQEALLSELRDFEDKLRRVANLHLDPDLNDGVVLNIAPLRELVPWKEAKTYWDELLAGKYAWSSIGKQLRKLSLVRSP